ncbi:M48 family metallopeptidase [Patescibacteria group bacterium]
MKKGTKLIEKEEIVLNGNSFPVEIFTVFGRSSSVRIKNGKIIIKISRFSFGFERKRIKKKFLNWALKKLKDFKESDFIKPVYKHRSRVCTHNKCYEIFVKKEDRKNNKTELCLNGEIIFRLSKHSSNKDEDQLIKQLTEKLIIKDQSEYLVSTIDELNQLYFQERINFIKFRRSNSRFGSCSVKRNINISLRLLFAPREVFRYVCIHELAHLKEFNHSKKFWSLVKDAMPEYKEHEIWLKNNGFMLG